MKGCLNLVVLLLAMLAATVIITQGASTFLYVSPRNGDIDMFYHNEFDRQAVTVSKNVTQLQSIFNSEFILTFSTTPQSGSGLFQASGVIGNDPYVSSKPGMSFFSNIQGTSMTIRVADGNTRDTFSFTHSQVPYNTPTTRQIQVERLTGARVFSVFVNGRLVGRKVSSVSSDIFSTGVASFGLYNNAPAFSGSLTYFRAVAAEPCDFAPCNEDKSSCINTVNDYKCLCKAGFEGVDDLTGNDCVETTPSCKTCEQLGWSVGFGTDNVCSFAGVAGYKCNARTFAQAETLCKNIGARLCTANDLQKGESVNGGCGINDEYIWSSTACDAGKVLAFVSAPGLSSEKPPQCVSKTNSNSIFVKCCADTPQHFRSSKSCAELKWPVVAPNVETEGDTTTVCGESDIALTSGYEVSSTSNCFYEKNYETSNRICRAVGGRLCTLDEMQRGETAGTGCYLDTNSVWTSTECVLDDGKPGFFTQIGQQSQSTDPVCVAPTETLGLGVRCCADVIPSKPIPSEKTCSELNWITSHPTHPSSADVCGHSLEGCQPINNRGNPTELKSFEAANTYCSSKGGRLCTYPEAVGNEAAGTGCAYDVELVWTQTPCTTCESEQGHIARVGNSKTSNNEQCLNSTQMAFVRCCASQVADCSRAGTGVNDCSSLNRKPCESSGKANTCGACFPGLTGVSGAANTLCVDSIAPRITQCPADLVVSVDGSDGTFSKAVTLPKPSVVENYSYELTFTPPSGSVFHLGTTKVTVLVSDIANNTASCSFNVIITSLTRAGISDSFAPPRTNPLILYEHEQYFNELFSRAFFIQVDTTPIGSISVAMYIQSPVVANDQTGLAIIAQANSVTIRHNVIGGSLDSVSFSHPFAGTTFTSRKILFTPKADGLVVRFFLNGQELVSSSPKVLSTGQFYFGGGIFYGRSGSQSASSALYSLKIQEAFSCDENPCGDRAVCKQDENDKQVHSCMCKSGYSGVANTSGEGCQPLQKSCKSCTELGWLDIYGESSVCAESEGFNGVCFPEMATYAQAERVCANEGARLCTLSEIQRNEGAYTGCNYDSTRIWALDKCGTNSAYTLGGSISSQNVNPLLCASQTSRASVRCCADADDLYYSSKTCQQLGWNENVPTVQVTSRVCGNVEFNITYDGGNVDIAGCALNNNYNQAEKLCANAGGRLCTKNELASGVALYQSLCTTLATSRVWAFDECADKSKAWTLSIDTDQSVIQPQCVEKGREVGIGVACCATTDIPKPQKSSKTCSQLGWEENDISTDSVCGHSYKDCSSTVSESDKMSYEDASSYCEGLGARLCSYSEILREETSNSGCLYNDVSVWTSTSCRQCAESGQLVSSHITHSGHPKNTISEFDRNCTSDADKSFVRCCADAIGDCSKAGLGDGSCFNIGRKACSTTPNSCGDCLETLSGNDGPSNTPCEDTTPPKSFDCPSNITVTANTTSRGREVSYSLPTTSDNWGIRSYTTTHSPNSFFDVGTTRVSITAEDYAGLTTTCNFFITVLPSPLSISLLDLNREVRDSSFIIPEGDHFMDLFNGHFYVDVMTNPQNLTSPYVAVPLVIGSIPSNSQKGVFIIVFDENVVVALSDGTTYNSLTFNIPEANQPQENTATKVRVLISIRGNRRLVQVVVNNVYAGGQFTPISNDVYGGGSIVFGTTSATSFFGVLTSLFFREMDACNLGGCGPRGLCILDENDFTKRTCQCKPGYTGEPVTTGQPTCTAVKTSCATCDALGWAAIGAERLSCYASYFGSCIEDLTFSEAETFCHNRRSRLCTASELGEVSANSNQVTVCGYNSKRVWTRDSCSRGHISQGIDQSGVRNQPPTCGVDSQKLPVVCCADRGYNDTWRSELSCAELGWPAENPESNSNWEGEYVCAASSLKVSDTFHYSNEAQCVNANFYRAEQSCALVGARLCTSIELGQDEAASRTCGLNSKRVWTSKECNATHALSRAGSQAGVDDVLPRCESKSNVLGVRCCADTTPQKSTKELSEMTCDQLQWATSSDSYVTSGKVCGKSPSYCDGLAPETEKKTYEEASGYCLGIGSRLCTHSELLAGESSGSGCSYDFEYVWSSTLCNDCGSIGRKAAIGHPDQRIGDKEESICLFLSDKAFVRCCADAGADCTRAGPNKNGDCSSFNRQECSSVANTCGPCLSGFTGTSGASNVDDCVDVAKPTITCPNSILVEVDAGVNSTAVVFSSAVATDNVGVVSIESDVKSGSSFKYGMTTVTFTAIDKENNSASCSFAVEVAGPSQCPAGFTQVSAGSPCTRCGEGTYAPPGSIKACERFRCQQGFADTDKNSTTPCVLCDGKLGYSDELGATECKATTTCAAGFEEVVSPSISTDRVCDECSFGLFKAASGSGRCKPYSTCPPGSFIATNATFTSNRVCEDCDFGNTFSSSPNWFTCKPVLSACAPGFQPTKQPTTSTDRVCAPCPTGYANSESNLSGCKACLASCPPGKYLTPCTSVSPSQCVACPSGTYSNNEDDTACQVIKQVCGNGEYISVEGSVSSDVECSECSACGSGMYAMGGCNGVNNRICGNCVTASDCNADEFFTGRCDPALSPCQPCHPTCSGCAGHGVDKCTDCQQGLVFQEASTDPVSTGLCTSSCSTGNYIFNDVCEPCYSTCASCYGGGSNQCLSCSAGLYLVNGLCRANCTGSGEYFRDSQTATCRKCTTCLSSQFQSSPCTETQDRTCDILSECDFDEFEEAAPTATSDRQCARCSTCAAGQYTVGGSCGGVKDTICVDCIGGYTNEPGEFSCASFEPCPSGYEEIKAPTPTSQRQCAICASGMLEVNGKCVTCPDFGVYLPAGSSGYCNDFKCAHGSANLDGDASTPCDKCTLASSFQDSTGAFVCKDVTPCGAGQVQVAPPTLFADRVCGTCPPNTFQSELDFTGTSCTTATSCLANEYEVRQPSISTDRVCASLTQCTSLEYELQPPTSFSDRICSTVRHCVEGYHEIIPPTTTSDRVCGMSGSCPEEIAFEMQPATSTTDVMCGVVTSCTPTQFEIVAPTITSNRECEDVLSCLPLQFEILPPTPTSNRVCESIRVCNNNEYEVTSPSTNENRVCAPISNCSSIEFEVAAFTVSSNRRCKLLTICNDDKQYELVSPTPTSNRICDTLRECNALEFEIASPTPSTDRECERVALCASYEYEASVPTPTTDRECSLTTVCGSNEYEVKDATTTSNRECKRLSTCEINRTFEHSMATATSDRECHDVITCAPDEYEFLPPTLVFDRRCKPVTNCCTDVSGCFPLYFYNMYPTTSSDAECSEATLCMYNEWESVVFTPSSDRSCLPLTRCVSTQYIDVSESVPPTATSDRECTKTLTMVFDFSYDFFFQDNNDDDFIAQFSDYLALKLGLLGDDDELPVLTVSRGSVLVTVSHSSMDVLEHLSALILAGDIEFSFLFNNEKYDFHARDPTQPQYSAQPKDPAIDPAMLGLIIVCVALAIVLVGAVVHFKRKEKRKKLASLESMNDGRTFSNPMYAGKHGSTDHDTIYRDAEEEEEEDPDYQDVAIGYEEPGYLDVSDTRDDDNEGGYMTVTSEQDSSSLDDVSDGYMTITGTENSVNDV
eukprot:m.176868 g.176868  ORF g.176868 m.176868 type:complete len:3563 (-) comp13539_c0_seq1:184-10872(-)